MKLTEEGIISKYKFREDNENRYIQMLQVISMAAFFF